MLGGDTRRTRLVLALAVTATLAAVLVLSAGALAALPAVLAFLPLIAGHYVGADRLEALIERRLRAPRRRASISRPRQIPYAFRARGGRLIAFALAERPPPAAAALI